MMLSVPLMTLLLVGAQAPQADGAGQATAVAPFLGDEVVAVAQLDLTRLDAEASVKKLFGDLADEPDVNMASKAVNSWVDALRKAGAKDLFVLIDPADFPREPAVILPLSDGADGRAMAKVLSEVGPRGPGRWSTSETIRGALVAGTPDAVARIREAKPGDRPEFAAALAAAGTASVRVAIVPSTTQRRAIEETLPDLPAELGGSPITTLTRGLRWASLAIAFDEPAPTLRVVVQTKDADSARSLQELAQNALKQLDQQAAKNPAMTEVAKLIGQLTPRAQGDRILLEADLQKSAALIAMPIRNARGAALRTQCVNNVKQIGLAMHNYHSVHNAFPPAYSASQDGKPLLSWRVHILPFLDQKSLYEKFKLDEPWDSPHNKALIARMPPTYFCPSGNQKLAAEGKTTYLTPRGPATIFPGAKPVGIKEITDGLSNTILVVDASDDSAVTWTKPDDWEVTTPLTVKGLYGHHMGGTSFGFGDGSVKFIRDTLAPQVLQKLLTRNGGEPVGADEY